MPLTLTSNDEKRLRTLMQLGECRAEEVIRNALVLLEWAAMSTINGGKVGVLDKKKENIEFVNSPFIKAVTPPKKIQRR